MANPPCCLTRARTLVCGAETQSCVGRGLAEKCHQIATFGLFENICGHVPQHCRSRRDSFPPKLWQCNRSSEPIVDCESAIAAGVLALGRPSLAFEYGIYCIGPVSRMYRASSSKLLLALRNAQAHGYAYGKRIARGA
jgi:hypothetical protein